MRRLVDWALAVAVCAAAEAILRGAHWVLVRWAR